MRLLIGLGQPSGIFFSLNCVDDVGYVLISKTGLFFGRGVRMKTGTEDEFLRETADRDGERGGQGVCCSVFI